MAEKLNCSFDATCAWTSKANKDDPKAQQEYTEHFVQDHGTARAGPAQAQANRQTYGGHGQLARGLQRLRTPVEPV